MLNRGHVFIKKLDEARGKIVKLAANFIEDGSVSETVLIIKINDNKVNFSENSYTFQIQSSVTNIEKSSQAKQDF